MEFLAKSFNSPNIIAIQQQQSDYHQAAALQSPKKVQKFDEEIDEKCCNGCYKQTKYCNCRPSSPSTTTKICTKLNNNINNSNNNNNVTTLLTTLNGGCSRTNPVDWSSVSIKKEPGVNNNTMVPCQVAEITTSVSPIVKVEITSPTIHNKCTSETNTLTPVVTTNGKFICFA